MPTLDRDGVEIYYEVHGSGPVVLLTHGYSATSEMWRGQIQAFTRKHTLVIWDMRGHGLSASPDDPDAYSELATVADMGAVLDAIGADRAIVGGLSLGGYMSLAFHRAYPERVRALMIIDTGPGYRNDEARTRWNQTAVQRAERFERDGLAALGRSAEVLAAQHRSAQGLALSARGMLTQRDGSVIESLPTVAVPAIVIAGADDEPFLKATEFMVARIPGAEKAIIPNAGHAVNIDQPEAFNATVTAFLDHVG